MSEYGPTQAKQPVCRRLCTAENTLLSPQEDTASEESSVHDPVDNQLLQATADPFHRSATSHATQKHAASVRGTSARVRALAGMGPVSASLGTEGSTARYGNTIRAATHACDSCSNRAHKVNKGASNTCNRV